MQAKKGEAELHSPRPAGPEEEAVLVGDSLAMQACRRQLQLLARSDRMVLLSGETGTGKEQFARWLHRHGERRRLPFRVLDCRGGPALLADFAAELARGGSGTLLLDEIVELPLPLQRWLEERLRHDPWLAGVLGVSLRLLLTSSELSPRQVMTGRLRGSLFNLLQPANLQLTPLRHRPEDIAPLAEALLARQCRRYRLPAKGLMPESLQVLKSHAWPGNLRELDNSLEQALLAARFEPHLFPKHFPLHLRLNYARQSLRRLAG